MGGLAVVGAVCPVYVSLQIMSSRGLPYTLLTSEDLACLFIVVSPVMSYQGVFYRENDVAFVTFPDSRSFSVIQLALSHFVEVLQEFESRYR